MRKTEDQKRIAALEVRIGQLNEAFKSQLSRAEIGHAANLRQAVSENETLVHDNDVLKREIQALQKSLERYNRFTDVILSVASVIGIVAERLPHVDAVDLFNEIYRTKPSAASAEQRAV